MYLFNSEFYSYIKYKKKNKAAKLKEKLTRQDIIGVLDKYDRK